MFSLTPAISPLSLATASLATSKAAPNNAASGVLLSVRALSVRFGPVRILRNMDMDVRAGEILALVGESGSGKSVFTRAVLGMTGKTGQVTGSIRFLGQELVGAPERELAALRGAAIGLIVQDAMSALNPMYTIGYQLMETIAYRHPEFRDKPGLSSPFGLLAKGRARRARIKTMAENMLRTMGIPAPHERMKAYPHQLSGGMRQRVMLALSMAGQARLLLADEPTTALDVVVQQQVLQRMVTVAREHGSAVVLVTHDLHLAADVADRVVVLYAGSVLEYGPTRQILAHPHHPYTRGLLAAMPGPATPRGGLSPIPGEVPAPADRGCGCPFFGRCLSSQPVCAETLADLAPVMEAGTLFPDWKSRCSISPSSPWAPSPDRLTCVAASKVVRHV